MASILIATLPFAGHVNPMLPVIRKLVEHGHTVRWYCARPFAGKIESVGASFLEMKAVPQRGQGNGYGVEARLLRRLGFGGTMVDWQHTFIDPIEGQVRELEAGLADFSADVLLSDLAAHPTAVTSERHGLPWAILGITPLTLKSRDIPPFFLGMRPGYSRLGHLRVAFLYWLADQVIFRKPRRYFQAKSRQNGWGFRSLTPLVSPYLHLQASVPALEYPRSDLPPQVHFIGPLLPEADPDYVPPDWWGELRKTCSPVVLVTQGTIATDIDNLLAPALKALASEDVLVIATTITKTAEELGLIIPKNAHVEKFIPFANLMPHVSVCITNGGFGGVNLALAHGVPVIVAGVTEEKPEVANRVEYAGAGINLRTATPRQSQIRGSVQRILADKNYRKRSLEIQAQIQSHDPPAEAAVLIERLAETRKPVLAIKPTHNAGYQEEWL